MTDLPKYDSGVTHCHQPACNATVGNNKWAHIRADNWFFSKDGTAYCPKHIPSWVMGWRLRKQGWKVINDAG